MGIGFHGGLLLTALIGALLGAWAASMIGIMVPNTVLKRFDKALAAGEILMMVDIPKERVSEIEAYVVKKHQ